MRALTDQQTPPSFDDWWNQTFEHAAVSAATWAPEDTETNDETEDDTDVVEAPLIPTTLGSWVAEATDRLSVRLPVLFPVKGELKASTDPLINVEVAVTLVRPTSWQMTVPRGSSRSDRNCVRFSATDPITTRTQPRCGSPVHTLVQ